MTREARLVLAVFLLAGGGPLAQAQPGGPTPATPPTTVATAPLDLAGEWRQAEVVVTLVQQGSAVTGSFRYVAPNPWGLRAGDRTFTGTLEGRALRGKLASRAHVEDCPGLEVEEDLALEVSPEGDVLSGQGRVAWYGRRDCGLLGRTSEVALRLRRAPCREERLSYERARARYREAAARRDDLQARYAAAVEERFRPDGPGTEAERESRLEAARLALVAAEGEVDAAVHASEMARLAWESCARLHAREVCEEWRRKFEAVRDEFGKRLEAYSHEARILDEGLVNWLQTNHRNATVLLSATEAYEGTYAQLMDLEKVENPAWVEKAVGAVETTEEVVGWILLAKGAVGMLARGGKAVMAEATERAIAKATAAATLRMPRLMRLLEKAVSGRSLFARTPVAAWAREAFLLRNTRYFQYGNKKWAAKVAKMSEEGPRVLHQMDEIRWSAFQDALRDASEELARLHPGKLELQAIFTGSSSKVAKEVMEKGRLPGQDAMKGIKDYAGLGSDIDFQFVLRQPSRQGDLVANLDDFYKLQLDAEKTFNLAFAKRMGFHPELCDVKLFPTSAWFKRGSARSYEHALDDVITDLAYNKRKFLDGEYYITPGSRMMKELMDEAGDALYSIGGKGFRKADPGDYFKGIEFHPGSGHGIVEESAMFAEKYLHKVQAGKLDPFEGARKYSKYYLRSAFGKIASTPEGARLLSSPEFRRALRESGKDLQTATVEAAQRFRGTLFSDAELRSLEKALQLKGARDPRAVLGGSEAAAREFFDEARGNMLRTSRDAEKAAERYWAERLAGARSEAERIAITAEKDAYSHARTFSVSRALDDPKLLGDLGVSAERQGAARAARDANPKLEDPPLGTSIEKIPSTDASSLAARPPPRDQSPGMFLLGLGMELLNPFTYVAKKLGEGWKGLLKVMTEGGHESLLGDLARQAGFAKDALIPLWKFNDSTVAGNGLVDRGKAVAAFDALFEGRDAHGRSVYRDFLPVVDSVETDAERECVADLKREWDVFLALQAETLGDLADRHERQAELADKTWQLGQDFGAKGAEYYWDQLRYVGPDTVAHPMSLGPIGIARIYATQVLEALAPYAPRLTGRED